MGIQCCLKKFESLIRGSEPLFTASSEQYGYAALPDNKASSGSPNTTDKSDIANINKPGRKSICINSIGSTAHADCFLGKGQIIEKSDNESNAWLLGQVDLVRSKKFFKSKLSRH